MSNMTMMLHISRHSCNLGNISISMHLYYVFSYILITIYSYLMRNIDHFFFVDGTIAKSCRNNHWTRKHERLGDIELFVFRSYLIIFRFYYHFKSLILKAHIIIKIFKKHSKIEESLKMRYLETSPSLAKQINKFIVYLRCCWFRWWYFFDVLPGKECHRRNMRFNMIGRGCGIEST